MSVCPYPEKKKKKHPSFVDISPTLVIDTSMERSSHEYYNMETPNFFQKNLILNFDLCQRAENRSSRSQQAPICRHRGCYKMSTSFEGRHLVAY